jgi:hypothetical protein
MKMRQLLLYYQTNTELKGYFWQHILRKFNVCIYFVTCQQFLDFRDQIVSQDYSSVCMQELYGACKSSRLPISAIVIQQSLTAVAGYS